MKWKIAVCLEFANNFGNLAEDSSHNFWDVDSSKIVEGMNIFRETQKIYKLAGIEAPSLSLVKIKSSVIGQSLSLVKIKSSVIGQKRSILKWGEKENAFYSEKGNISIEKWGIEGNGVVISS